MARKSDENRKYYTTLGTAVLDQCGYDLNAVGKVYKESRMRTLLGPDIHAMFQVGGVYTKKEIKEALKILYRNKNIERNAKATDMNLFFEISPTKITVAGERMSAFRLIRRI